MLFVLTKKPSLSSLTPKGTKLKPIPSFSEKANSVKMTSISEKLNVDTQEFEVKDNTHVPPKDTTDDGSVRCSLKIEVIDDTAMIDISQGGKSRPVYERFKSGTNKKKKNANHQVEKENGEKMVARKAKGRNMAEAKEKNVLISDGCKRKGGEEKMIYRRKELENLRFIGIEEQRKKWVEVYCGLGDTVQKEYDGLLQSSTQNHIRGHLGKENTPVISGVLAAKERGKHMKVYTQRGMTYMNLQNTVCLPSH